ncbi:Nn.00g054680.m01.CDS01 [Neocucurbitaria sp. VM-36]
MSDAEFFAMLCHVQFRTDSAATPELRTVFSSEAAIQHLIEESSLTFAPGLADMIRSRNTPSVQQLRACSVLLSRDDLKLKWIVYLQYYRKGPLWYIYCGKTTNVRGAQERLLDYENEKSTIAESIRVLVKSGFERMSHTNLAAVDIPFEGADRIYVAALVTALEATFTTGLWAYSRRTLGSVTPLRFWEEVPWFGLCSHSSLLEITFGNLEDEFPNLDELRLAWKERQKLASQKYRSSEKGQAALERHKDSLKEAYRTDEEFRDERLHYSKQYTADGKQAIARAKYKASEKYKSTEAAYKDSGALAKTKSRYATSDKNKAAQAKYAASEKGKASAKKKQAKYRASVKAKRQLKAEEKSASEKKSRDGKGLPGGRRQGDQGQSEVQLDGNVHAVQLGGYY